MNITATEKSSREQYPLFSTIGTVVFPGMTTDIEISSEENLYACRRAVEGDSLLFLTSYKLPFRTKENLKLSEENLEECGTMVYIEKTTIGAERSPRIVVRGVARARLIGLRAVPDGSFDADFVWTDSQMAPGSPQSSAHLKLLQEALNYYCEALPVPIPESVQKAVELFDNPGALADFLVAKLGYLPAFKQHILAIADPAKRAEEVITWLFSEHDRLTVDAEIRGKVAEHLKNNQREYQLREQLRVIKAELGESDDEEDDEEIIEYRKRIADAHLPTEVEEKLSKEVSKLAKTPYASAESTVLRQYLDTCLEIPFSKYSKERRSVTQAEKILDKDHACMEKVKERILEFIAVRARNPQLKNQILCFVGAPGTGKTSVSASIAKALNRKFVRVCLGGIRDEAEIRGHRKTYIGAMPGRIITALRQAGVMNPVILLDELDKMASDSHGDPSAAMLEVLDSEQNCHFRDHFVELPVDLSDCIFIATANNRAAIPAPLMDRMEFIELPPYLRSEKLRIAQEHLLPKQMERHGLNKKVLRISDSALFRIIDDYTREAGVRELERELAKLCRKVAAKLEAMDQDALIRIDAPDVPELLGPSHLTDEELPSEDSVGTVNGLAWTEMGGAMLRVEACTMPGSGKLQLTGSLGDVMKESAQLAVSYLRVHAAEFGIDPDFHKKLDIHIHLPEGAVPKDGPSAGVTLTTALFSELTGRRVRRDVAMTGEISLRGDVLPIGGLREKSSAACRAGVKTVLIPEGNRPDLTEIPAEIKQAIEFIPVSRIGQVLDVAVLAAPNA